MPDIMSAIQPVLAPALQVAQLGSTGYNLYNQYQNQQYQNQLRSYAQDPAKMNAYTAKFTQPLTAGLTAGVANQAQADLATRGLTDSPEISQQVYAQAIAPYIQQNQQQGYQDALQALQVGGGAIPPGAQQQQSLGALAKAFSMMGGGSNPLAKLLQLSQGAPTPQPQAPVPNDPSIPFESTQQTIDLSSTYQPDYGSFGTDSGIGDTGG